MGSWSGDGNAALLVPCEGEQKAMLHWDEDTLKCVHNQQFTKWIREGETAGLYKKEGRVSLGGVSLVVADFVCPKDGFLQQAGGLLDNDKDELGGRNHFEDEICWHGFSASAGLSSVVGRNAMDISVSRSSVISLRLQFRV